jgi:hypothetical protein
MNMTLTKFLFENPYFYGVSIAARMITHIATFFLSILVFFNFVSTASRFDVIYEPLNRYLPEKSWVLVLFGCSVAGCSRLWLHAQPSWAGTVIYGVLALWWNYVAFAYWFVVGTPIPPIAVSSVTTIALVSLYAFAANPRIATVEGKSGLIGG